MDPSRNSQRSYGVPPAATSFPFWSPNVFYPQASLVWYAGSVWRCEAPHTSGALAREVRGGGHCRQSGTRSCGHGGRKITDTHATALATLQPNLSPHLWTPISDANDRPQTQATAYGRISPLPSYDGKTGTYITNYREVYDRGGRGSSTGVGSSACLPSLAPSPVTQVRPYSDRSRLNALLEEAKAARSSGALRNELLGARTWRVGGVGVFAYAEDPAIERTRKQAWREFTEANGRSAWLSAARARTAAYSQAKTRGELHPLLRWELVEDSAPLPPEAIPCGFESGGNELYAARMWHENGMHVGKWVHNYFNSSWPCFADD